MKTRPAEKGFTLLELVITLIALAVLTLGALPLVQTTVRRQREYELHEALREMRQAIEEFRRDAMGCPNLGGTGTGQPPTAPVQPGQPGQPGQPNQPLIIDPRSKVCISDNTIFTVDNPDRYPPDLDTLVNGVNVVPRAGAVNPTGGGGLTGGGPSATEQGATLSTKKKIYLRAIPVDPTTGKADWCLRSLYDSPDASSCGGGPNVFDVRSKSTGTALNGEKYSEW
jgi:general secretion pathway protein G